MIDLAAWDLTKVSLALVVLVVLPGLPVTAILAGDSRRLDVFETLAWAIAGGVVISAGVGIVTSLAHWSAAGTAFA